MDKEKIKDAIKKKIISATEVDNILDLEIAKQETKALVLKMVEDGIFNEEDLIELSSFIINHIKRIRKNDN